MPYDDYINALNIFAKYPHREHLSAEHDIIYAGPSPDEVTSEDKATLEELGWHESDADCFYKFV